MNAAELVDALSYQNRPNVRGGKNPQKISAAWLNYTSGSDALSDTSVANGVRKLAHVKDLQLNDIVEMLYFPERQEYLIIGRLHRVGEQAGLPEIGRASFVRKTSDESVLSSTALQADDELAFPVVGGLYYEFSFNLMYQGATSTTVGGIKWGINLPSGSNIWMGQQNAVLQSNITGTSAFINPYGYRETSTGTTANSPFSTAGSFSGADIFLEIKGSMQAGANGELRLTWAQAGSSPTFTTVFAGSWASLTRIS